MAFKKYKALESFGVEGGSSVIPKQELELNPEEATTRSWLKHGLIGEVASLATKKVKVK
jgi:hypothetical protein